MHVRRHASRKVALEASYEGKGHSVVSPAWIQGSFMSLVGVTPSCDRTESNGEISGPGDVVDG